MAPWTWWPLKELRYDKKNYAALKIHIVVFVSLSDNCCQNSKYRSLRKFVALSLSFYKLFRKNVPHGRCKRCSDNFCLGYNNNDTHYAGMFIFYYLYYKFVRLIWICNRLETTVDRSTKYYRSYLIIWLLILIYNFYIIMASFVKGGGHKILDRCTLPLTGQTFGQDRYDRTGRKGTSIGRDRMERISRTTSDEYRTTRHGSERDGTGRDGMGRVGTGRDGTGQLGTERDSSGRNGSGSKGMGRDVATKDI